MKKHLSALLLALLLAACCALTAAAAGFADVPEGAWYSDAVEYMRERGYMLGTSSTAFEPESPFTRAQMATVLWRLAGTPHVSGDPEFSDTRSGMWYSEAVVWAARSNIVNGYGGGLFGPNDSVTQEQLVTMLWRRAGEPRRDGGDEGGVSPWAAEAVRWARETVLDEKGYTFSPKAPAPRALVAVLTQRADAAAAPALRLKIGGVAVAAEWEDNASVEALRALVREKPLTIAMSMYGGFEQVGPIGARLPSADVRTTTSAGDIVLYSGDQLVVFYGSNTWEYTRLGRITGMDKAGLSRLLGNGNVTVTIETEEAK